MRLIVILAVSLFLLPANLVAAGRTDQLLWKCNGTLPNEVDRIMGKMQGPDFSLSTLKGLLYTKTRDID